MASAGPVIVKLGGSILTRKREEGRVRPKVLARLAQEIASAATPVVLLHGAGSFGHPGAVRFRLAEPPEPNPDPHRARGAAIVAAEVRKLHGRVLAALVEAGSAPVSVPASTLATNRGGRLDHLDPALFQSTLAAGQVPVSFGDVVRDSEWGFSILSADAIAVALAGPLHAGRVLFVTDVDGVYETPSDGGRRKLIPRLTDQVVESLPVRPGVPDVTGGIRAKAQAMLALGRAGIRAGLISGLRHHALSRALKGEEVYGSWSGPDS
jgi:isopentenyl phosphate kinase